MSAKPNQSHASDGEPLDLVDEGSSDSVGVIPNMTAETDDHSFDCLPTVPDERDLGPIGALPVGMAEIATGLGAAATAVSVVAKAKIEARAEVRKAEIEAEVRRLEITEETRREQMRLDAERPAPTAIGHQSREQG
ncbi:hypothetical protein ACFZB9_07990 [Kitasatospora sp. NPDC008050]|uniref:hypothetical protein n=1 Tax=Kitasatospora sp. NPDC008050 TaxID=3364021 RepID=UPI0036E0E028